MVFSIVVILYDSQIADSETLQSLLQAEMDGYSVNLSIWNNGPTLLKENDIEDYKERAAFKNIQVKIYQNIRNIALSKIYNFLIEKRNFDFFIPLDQDTGLDKDYFKIIKAHSNLDIILPYIYTGLETVQFPFNTKDKQPIVADSMVDPKTVTSINSGLVINSRLVNLFLKYNTNMFDERFAFYGIDTVFFLNLHELCNNQLIKAGCFGKIKHSLAMYEKNGKVSYQRNLELIYFKLLYRRFYKNKSKLSIFYLAFTFLCFGNIKTIQGLKGVLCCLIEGHHPRSIINIHTDTLT